MRSVPVPQARSATLREAGNSWSFQSTPTGQSWNTSRQSSVPRVPMCSTRR